MLCSREEVVKAGYEVKEVGKAIQPSVTEQMLQRSCELPITNDVRTESSPGGPGISLVKKSKGHYENCKDPLCIPSHSTRGCHNQVWIPDPVPQQYGIASGQVPLPSQPVVNTGPPNDWEASIEVNTIYRLKAVLDRAIEEMEYRRQQTDNSGKPTAAYVNQDGPVNRQCHPSGDRLMQETPKRP